jgi:hypothetical protein
MHAKPIWRRGMGIPLWLAAALFVMLSGGVAMAQTAVNLQGTWQFSRVDALGKRYSGNIVIDSSNQAKSTVKTPKGVVVETGNVTVSGNSIVVTFTSVDASQDPAGYDPDRYSCTVQSANMLLCSNEDTRGEVTAKFVVTRS